MYVYLKKYDRSFHSEEYLIYVSDALKFECKNICKLGSQSCKALGIEPYSKCFKGTITLQIQSSK